MHIQFSSFWIHLVTFRHASATVFSWFASLSRWPMWCLLMWIKLTQSPIQKAGADSRDIDVCHHLYPVWMAAVDAFHHISFWNHSKTLKTCVSCRFLFWTSGIDKVFCFLYFILAPECKRQCGGNYTDPQNRTGLGKLSQSLVPWWRWCQLGQGMQGMMQASISSYKFHLAVA